MGPRSGWVPGQGQGCSGVRVVENSGTVLGVLRVRHAMQPVEGLPAAQGVHFLRGPVFSASVGQLLTRWLS